MKDLYNAKLGQPRHGLKVLSTFSCGGGSSMGYKLAGFDVVGCVEIDQEMLEHYKANLSPRHLFHMPIQEFNKMPLDELPDEVRSIDVLDGSPPCSVFSTAGRRKEGWGIEKSFREGQAMQRLDDLFFHFIESAKRLRPKIIVAENVTGMLKAEARGYVKEIFAGFRAAGYDTQLFQMNGAKMGVPQVRNRIFFIGRRSDLDIPPFGMEFDERERTIGEAFVGLDESVVGAKLNEGTKMRRLWEKTIPGRNFSDAAGGTSFGHWRLSMSKPSPTILATHSIYAHQSKPYQLSTEELVRVQSFPDDYKFVSGRPQYVMGMSVPPLMMQRISLKIAESLLSRT